VVAFGTTRRYARPARSPGTRLAGEHPRRREDAQD
jgi:hypothetical protein